MRNNQNGFTLIEILIATAITAIILSVITAALSQTISISWAGHKRMDTIKQVENALYVINRDAQVACSISTGSAGNWLVITLGDDSTIEYKIIEPGNQAPVYLQRTCGGSSTSLAQYVDTAAGMTVCSYNGSVLDVQVTATLDGLGAATESRRMVIYPRLNLSTQE